MSRTSRTFPQPLKKSSRSLGLMRLESCMQKTVRMSRSSGVSSGERTRFGGVRECRRRRSRERERLLRRRSRDLERLLRRRRSLERDLVRSRFDFLDLDLERERERLLAWRRSRLRDLLRSLRFFLLKKMEWYFRYLQRKHGNLKKTSYNRVYRALYTILNPTLSNLVKKLYL